MKSTIDASVGLRGGEFLVKDSKPTDSFIPEEFNAEQLMVLDTVEEFIEKRVLPNGPQIEKLDLELTMQLIREAGELGINGTAFPEEYGGFMQDFVTNIRITELMGRTRSFSLSIGAHTGIGMLPILYFGNEAQKQKYLPPLIQGIKQAAYCLTEPSSGSDALAAKTKAVLNQAGTHYLLNGQKMWITNAGFADVFVVFAKVDGDKFTAFIVERNWEGLSVGAEEDKMGIKGSSTRQVFFENVAVPVENVLGDMGKGHRIAFNILNIGRIKLAAGVLGGAKMASTAAIEYANERKQFGRSIGSFGAIQHKIAEQAIRIYANESATYRASMDIQRKEQAMLLEGKPLEEALLGAAEEYAIECAMMKVHASECLDYVVDEGVQIYGGMGYSEETPMASAYRDARINRIFEGTNEINRMLVIDMLFKRAMKGELDLMSPAMQIQKELMGMPKTEEVGDGPLAQQKTLLKQLKKAVLMTAGATAQALMQDLKEEQEVLIALSDMISEVYIAESTILRTEKLINLRGEKACSAQIEMAQVFANDAVERFRLKGREAIAAWAEGDTKRSLLMGLKRFTKQDPINTKAARRRIAAQLLEANAYCF